MAQLSFNARIVEGIPRGAFYPPPKVDSAVVRLDVFEQTRLRANEIPRFFQIVRAGFGGKRKQLRNSLAHGLSIDTDPISTVLLNAQIQPSRRAETLSLEEWLALFRTISILPIVETKKSG
jgi:16S rRNA (adenine1518-N6/adenine1519-N6)-dimethyltransferase